MPEPAWPAGCGPGWPTRLRRRGPQCCVLRPRQDRHRQVERTRLRASLLPGRPDHAARRGEVGVRPAHVPARRRRRAADGAHPRPSRRPVQGWRVDQVSQIVNETLHELINPYVYAEAAALIDEHRAAGRDIVVVSTSGEEMVRPIVEQLGITDVIATRMVVEDGRYTGEVAYYAAGPTKAEAVRELAKERDYDLATCYAYSDSISDVPLLETVGHANVGQPRPQPAPGRRRARLAGPRVPPPGPAVAPAARTAGRPGRRGRARPRRRRRDRARPLRPAPPRAAPLCAPAPAPSRPRPSPKRAGLQRVRVAGAVTRSRRTNEGGRRASRTRVRNLAARPPGTHARSAASRPVAAGRDSP